jgi:cytochrome c-type biogenesis protein CcmH/NrfG
MLSKKRMQRLVLLISGGGFLISMTMGLKSMMTVEAPMQPAIATETSNQTQLQQTIQGYKAVVAREPNNLVALEGLYTAYLEAQEWQSAISPLEKLIALNPQNPDYATKLATLKAKIAQK